MIEIPFTKFHGAENDFLLTMSDRAPNDNLPEVARRICARTTGIGADGWMLVTPQRDSLKTRLFNSDGTEPEMSGNGSRCAGAFALINGLLSGPEIRLRTAAGPKTVRLLSRDGNVFLFEMDMGVPRVQELRTSMRLADEYFDVTTLNVGNPQCVIFVDDLPPNWREAAKEAEAHPRFPNRSNVSFVRVAAPNAIHVVFYERGAGETRSSGTGSTGAGTAAILRGVVESPVEIRTPAGSMSLRWDDSVYLTGPAELIGEGRFFVDL
jgi:diaminopimelate epimerase